jgi:hypothetical protein
MIIVKGLMWAESVDFRFLFRVSVVPAVRFIFLVIGVVRCRVVGLLLVAVLSGSLRLLPVVASLSANGCSGWTTGCSMCVVLVPDGPPGGGGRLPAYVIKGKGCVVLLLLWLWGMKGRFVLRVSRVGVCIPAPCAADVTSSQHCSLHTMASCRLRGKMGVGCKQLACHTRLHRVHSVSVPLSSHASH